MKKVVKARPAVLRALGQQDPPPEVYVDDQIFSRREIFKHDSWAATARYRGKDYDIVCKFNRKQPILLLPFSWLGRFLARREDFAYRTLEHIEGIAPACSEVSLDGRVLKNVVAHRFVAGHPLGNNEEVREEFFPKLKVMLEQVHAAGFAYVDLHKRENILVDKHGNPCLIDFQISFYSAPNQFWKLPGSGQLLRLLQRADLYHLFKHVKRHRPEQVEQLGLAHLEERPWYIKMHRSIAVPFRQTRRKLLTLIGVRGKSGRSNTEVFAEHAFRCEVEQKKKAA